MTQAVSLPIGCQKPHPPSSFIIITQSESRYSFYHPMEDRRLSRPRHCRRCTARAQGCISIVVFMRLPTVGFEPWSYHTTVRHVTSRPLRPAVYVLCISITQSLPTAVISHIQTRFVTVSARLASASASKFYPRNKDTQLELFMYVMKILNLK